MKRHATHPREDYGPIPQKYSVLSALWYARFAWYGVGGAGLLFLLLAPGVKSEQDLWAMFAFWVFLFAFAVASGVGLLRTRGAFYTLRHLDVRVTFRHDARDAYIPPEVYKEKLMSWLEYWARNPNSELGLVECIEAVRGHQSVIQGQIIDVRPLKKYNAVESASGEVPDFAFATTLREAKLIHCWKEQSQNWHGAWEWEWGHLLATAEWGWTTEKDSLEQRSAADLVDSRK